MKLIILRAGSPVTQADLDNLLTLDAQIGRLRKLRHHIAATILCRLAAGAEVEPGERSVELDESYQAGSRRQKLVVR